MGEGRMVGAHEAASRFGELLDRVEHGEEIVITRKGEAVAKLTRAEPAAAGTSEAALRRLAELRQRLRAEGAFFPIEELLSLRDEGRR